MMHFENSQEAAYGVTSMMEDVWNNRQRFQSLHLVYRLSVSNYDIDETKNFFAHYHMTPEFWHYLITDDMFVQDFARHYDMSNHIPENYDTHGGSWRRYLFTDILTGVIEKKIDQEKESINACDRVTLWSTFDVQNMTAA